MTHLFDTDHLSILQWPKTTGYSAVSENVARHRAGDVVACVVSFHEQLLGCHDRIIKARTPHDLVRGYEMLEALIKGFTGITVLPFDTAASSTFHALKSHKVRIATMDLRIAAIALSRNLTVVTRNARDFGQVPGLRIEDWTK